MNVNVSFLHSRQLCYLPDSGGTGPSKNKMEGVICAESEPSKSLTWVWQPDCVTSVWDMYRHVFSSVLGISNWTIWHRLEYERPFRFASPINPCNQDRLFSVLEINDQHEVTWTWTRAGRDAFSPRNSISALGRVSRKSSLPASRSFGSSMLNLHQTIPSLSPWVIRDP